MRLGLGSFALGLHRLQRFDAAHMFGGVGAPEIVHHHRVGFHAQAGHALAQAQAGTGVTAQRGHHFVGKQVGAADNAVHRNGALGLRLDR